jgi:hypothetical protein
MPVPSASFLVSFLIDSVGISLEGPLALFEDEFHPISFAQDTLFYFGLGLLMILLNFYQMKNS